jgi:DNA-directed RNA polymerase sigma subunit (sigma70/sigma32)
MTETEYFQTIDKVEEVKKYLQEIKSLDNRIKNKKEELQQLWSVVTSTTSTLKETTSRSNTVSDKVGKGVINIDELETEIREALFEFMYERHKRIKLIETLKNPLDYTVVYEHYVNYKKLAVIAEEINYSSDHISEIHRNAIKKLISPTNPM